MINIEKLKQKILDLAIRGKLVPQDPNDEPASVLIEKIRAEKAKLVKEGKIKASKEDSYIYKGSDNSYYEKIGVKTINIDDEIPFAIPESWCWTKLKYIGEIVGGGTPSTSVDSYWENGEIVWVTPAYMSSLKSIFLFDSYRKITDVGLNHSSTKLMPVNSIIMSSRAPIGYLAINKVPACTSQGCKSVVPHIEGMSEILLYFIRASISRVIGSSSGTTFDEISGKEFGELLIPIPPIKEQKRIVHVLTISTEYIEKIAENYSEISVLTLAAKRKILDEIFGESSSYKSYYPNKVELGDVLAYEQPGPYIVASTEYDNSYSTPVLTPGKSFILGYTNEKDGIYHVKDKVIIFDDFTTASRLIDFDFKVKSSAMKILHVADNTKFNIDYLYYLLQTIHFLSDTHKRFWISEYAPLQLKIHTLDDQLKIVNAIKRAFSIIDNISK